jgi:hypothetical protein
MTEFQTDRYRNFECVAEFDQLFPEGFAGGDVMSEIASEGWEKSPLLAVFHPSPEQVYEETLRLHRNLQSLPWRKADAPAGLAPHEMRRVTLILGKAKGQSCKLFPSQASSHLSLCPLFAIARLYLSGQTCNCPFDQ